MSEVFDLAIIGGGPGGYVCAIRAAQLGMKTAIIEKRNTMGGTCVNVGCIPSKALLDTSERYYKTLHGLSAHGISAGKVSINIKEMHARKDKIVKELTDGLKFLMNKNKITVFEGHGRFEKKGEHFNISAGSQSIQARKAVIATGSEVIPLPGLEVDGVNIIASDHAIALAEVPEHLVIIGGGVIGLELGSVWMRLGAKVTVVEVLEDILTMLDKPDRELFRRLLTRQGFEFLLEHKVTGASKERKGLKVEIENKAGEKQQISCSHLLLAVGRRPYTENLGLENAGVTLTNRGRVAVNRHTLETQASGIFAIGDVIDGPMLAHKAEEEGVMVAENLAGLSGHVNYRAIPGVVYTWPEIAWVGQMENEIIASGRKVKAGKFLFKPNGRAKAMQEGDGQVRIFADADTDELLGAVIIGPNASELIAEITIALEFHASAEDIARTCHAHPTLAEVIREAALDADKRALHS